MKNSSEAPPQTDTESTVDSSRSTGVESRQIPGATRWRTKKSSRTGFTLMEALVTLGIFFLALGFIGSFFTLGLQWHRSQSSHQDTQRELVMQGAQLERILSRGAASSLTLTYPSGNPANGDLRISAALPLNAQGVVQRAPGGEPIYTTYYIYHHDTTNHELRLSQQAVAVPSSTPPPALTPAEIVVALGLDPGRKLISNLQLFQVLDLTDRSQIIIPTRAFLLKFAAQQASSPAPMELTIPLRFTS